MKAFRIALKKYGPNAHEAFSGKSGFHANGRWHSSGRLLDYAAESRSLATLERIVHYKRFDCLARHVLYAADIPDEHIETVLSFPKGWNGPDLLPEAQHMGDAWCDAGRSPVLQVPSAVTPGEHNLIINSHHPKWDWKWVSGPEDFVLDRRLVALVKKSVRNP
jgi:RES domain-containing protein